MVVTLDQPATSGLTARVRLGVPLDARVLVPLSAIVDPTGTAPAVYRMRAHQVDRVAVRLDAIIGDDAAITGELAADEAVVVAGHAGLLPGDRVAVIP